LLYTTNPQLIVDLLCNQSTINGINGVCYLDLILASSVASDPLPDLLLQSGRGRSLAIVPFPSLDLLCGTVYRLNFGSSTVVLHSVDG